jgi:putative ABC transport system permease protein
METGPILRSMRRNKVRSGLLVLEVALTLAIVTNCAQMILKARAEMARPSGFDDAHLVSVRVVPFSEAYAEPSFADRVVRQDLAALRSLTGVRAATNTYFIPWQGGGSSTELRPAGSTGEKLRTQFYPADEGLVETLGNALVEGRMLSPEDVDRETALLRDLPGERERDADGRTKSPIVLSVVVSRAFARLAFPGATSFVGKSLWDDDGDLYRIVGVFDAFYNPYGWPIHEYAVFSPQRQASPRGMPFLVRARPGESEKVAAAVEKTLLAVQPDRAVTVRTVPEVKRRYLGPQLLMVRTLLIVIVLLLFVTTLGIVGVTTFSVAERTRQIGTRRALGATRGDILRYFLVENGVVTTLGIALGLVLTVGLNVALVDQAGMDRLSPALVVAGALLLLVAGALATLAPALRGSRVAPAVATRNV